MVKYTTHFSRINDISDNQKERLCNLRWKVFSNITLNILSLSERVAIHKQCVSKTKQVKIFQQYL